MDDQENYFFSLVDEQWGIIKGLQNLVDKDKHHRIITAIQGRRNSVVPKISTFPPEILRSVFLRLQSIYWNRPRNPYGWLKAVSVCRYWRDVIFSYPELFSYLEVADLDKHRLREFIRLSAAVPLTIYVTQGFSTLQDVEPYWRIIIPHLARAKFLQTAVAPRSMDDWPHCTLLKVFHWEIPFTNSFPHRRDPKRILSSMPNLEVFHGAIFSMGSGFLEASLAPTLRELHISHFTSSPCKISINRLGAVLAALPLLTHLHFSGIGEYDYLPSNPPHVAHPLLPRLKELHLSGAIKGVDNLLQLPFSAARVEVYMEHPPYLMGDLLPIPMPSVSLDKLWFGSNRYDPTMQVNTVHISQSHTSQDTSLYFWVSGDTTSVQFQMKVPDVKEHSMLWQHFIGQLTKEFLPATLDARELSISEAVPDLHTDNYEAWYFNPSYLSESTLVFISIPTRFASAGPNTVQRMGLIDMLKPADGNIPFPSLKRLQVQFWPIGHLPSSQSQGSLESLPILAELLSARLEQGHKLEKLQIIGVLRGSVTVAYQDAMKELSRLVGRFEVKPFYEGDGRDAVSILDSKSFDLASFFPQ